MKPKGKPIRSRKELISVLSEKRSTYGERRDFMRPNEERQEIHLSDYEATEGEDEEISLFCVRPLKLNFLRFAKCKKRFSFTRIFTISLRNRTFSLCNSFFRTINIKFCFYFTSVSFCGGPTTTTIPQDEKVKMEKSIIFVFLFSIAFLLLC